MILSVHFIAGAALSPIISNPLILAPAATALHFACDSIPHWEYDFLQIAKKKAVARIAIDLCAGIFITVFLLKGTSSLRLEHALWGGFFGLLPDGFLALHLLSGKRLFPRIISLHSFFHSLIIPKGFHPPAWLGILTQSIVVILSVFLLLYS